MSAAASGGLVGVGAGKGWLSDPSIPASDTDLVFGMLTEEWGLIIAILAVLSIITLSIFCRQIHMGGQVYLLHHSSVFRHVDAAISDDP